MANHGSEECDLVMTIPEIITALTRDDGVFPRKAMMEAVMQREAVTPELLRIIRDDTDNIAEVADRVDYAGHIFAMFLLAQFREERAYQPLVSFFTSCWKHVDRATGDIVTEDLGRILASVCNGDTSLIYGMVEDANLNEYVRGAALTAIVVLVAQGIKPRDEAMAYFRSLLREKLERERTFVWDSLVSHCCHIYPEEAMPEIEQAFEDGLVEPIFISPKSVQRYLAEGKDHVLARLQANANYSLINDAVRELDSSVCSSEYNQPAEASGIGYASMRPGPKVGRNEPCPCGSGKKYKKCCGR